MILGKKIFGSNSYFFSLTLQATNNMSSTASITSSTPRVNAPTPAKWTSARTLVLLECVRDQILLGKTSDTGLKKEAWAAIVISFNSKCNLHYDKQKLQSQLAVQKKKYQIVKTLRDNSGFGWDEAKQVPTAPDDVWIEYIAAHPEARPFRNSPLDHYVYLEEIFTGVIATGEYAVASGFNHDLDTNRNSADQDFSENLDSTNSNESAQTKRKISAVSIRKSPRKRIKSNPMAAAIQDLAKSHAKYAEMRLQTKLTSSQDAIKLFLANFQYVDPALRLQFVKHLTKNVDEAEMFIALDDQTRKQFVDEFVNDF
jgi:hypothetical protein